MTEKEVRKLVKELNEISHYDFKIRKYKHGVISLSYNGELGIRLSRTITSFEHVGRIMKKMVEF